MTRSELVRQVLAALRTGDLDRARQLADDGHLVHPRFECHQWRRRRSPTRKAITKLPDINTRELLRVELPSVNGTGTARAIATVYGDLATGGHALGIGQHSLDEIEREKPASFDQIFGLGSAFSFGFMKPFPILRFGSSPRAFGHTGSGGSFGYADPDAGVGYPYVMNRNGYSLPTDARESSGPSTPKFAEVTARKSFSNAYGQ